MEQEPNKPTLDKLGSYLAAVGNHEGKCLALLGFSNTQEIVDKYELSSRVSRMTNDVWRLHPDAIENYCQGSFCKIGLVTKKAIDHDGYMLTEDGLALAQPMAAYLLLKIHEYTPLYDLSLYDLFGATQSSTDNRSPQDSFTVLNTLAMTGSLTPIELAKKTGLKFSTISGNLKRLKKHGIVEYDTVSVDTFGSVKYSLRNDQMDKAPNPVGGEASLTQTVWNILKLHEGTGLNLYEVEFLIREHPALSLKYAFSQSLRERVANILAGINRQGLLDKNIKGVSIALEVKPFIEEVFPKLIAFMEKDPTSIREFNHAKGIVLGENEESNKIREDCMEKAREKSPWSPDNIGIMEKRFQAIKDYLLQHPNARPFEIAMVFDTSKEIVLRVLNTMMEDDKNKLKKTREGRATRYRIGD